jgi:hypothetical protein
MFMEAVLRREGLVCEVMGHIVINRRRVGKYAKRNWSLVFVVVTKPFDVAKVAMKGSVDA